MRPTSALLALALLVSACTQERPTEIPSLPPATSTAAIAPSPTATATLHPTATATAAPTPTPTATSAIAPTRTGGAAAPATVYDMVLGRVSAIRGLYPTEPIIPQFKTREELAVYLADNLEEEFDEVLRTQEVLRLLELIPADADLTELLLELYSEQVAGFYDSGEEELFLIGEQQEELSVQEEITLAHEFVHALQQQLYDIDSLLEGAKDNADAASALVALVEGDAVAVEFEYVNRHFTTGQLQAFLSSNAGASSVFDSTPYFLQQDLLFPYVEGLSMVFALRTRLKWDAVDDAYSNLPASTEQVLHPEKYVSGEAPIVVELPDAAAALGEEWEKVHGNVMGEFFLRTYLETRIGQGTAAEVAAGWGGDRYALLSGPQEEYALASLIVWDTAADAREFFDAMVDSESIAANGFMGLEDERVLWIVSPSEQVTEDLLTLWPDFR